MITLNVYNLNVGKMARVKMTQNVISLNKPNYSKSFFLNVMNWCYYKLICHS